MDYVEPHRISKRDQTDPLDLLMIHDEESGKSHFAWIKVILLLFLPFNYILFIAGF